ncbi:MAG: hypothetical protein ACKPKO_39460, partial [Candidatus Fonsibacter sp.]
PYNEHDNEDMKKTVLELNKEAEDELADLVNIKVPEVNKHKKHDIIKNTKHSESRIEMQRVICMISAKLSNLHNKQFIGSIPL